MKLTEKEHLDPAEMKKHLDQDVERVAKIREARNEKAVTTVRRVFSIEADTASHDEIRDRLLSGGQVTGTNMVVMVCAILIASVGLNTNSTAVIIGAMLISPLMGSIMAIAYGTASADYGCVRKHLIGFAFQIGASILTSMIYFALSPVKEATTELLARTSPSFFDVIIASVGGIAGIVGQTRADKVTNIIPGVAIATALMPPLCTCGYAIANGQWAMLGGAFYLFVINSYFIFMSSVVVLSLLRIPKVTELSQEQWKKLRDRMIRNAILIALPSIVFAVLMARG